MTDTSTGCGARHPEDSTVCEGPPDAVAVTDSTGDEVFGCRRHAAVLLAALGEHGRVGLGPGGRGLAAIDVYQRAQALRG
ncbi:MAG: hypothetical protein ACM4D3_24680 [Candidatus Sericytochromatia bacterium]